jgi:hypothetical protein
MPIFSQHDPADLPSQLEDILAAVWAAESNWRFDDRLDLALGERPPACDPPY